MHILNLQSAFCNLKSAISSILPYFRLQYPLFRKDSYRGMPMSVPVHCPKCEFAVSQPTSDTVLSHCPACGRRLICPRCGSTLQLGADETAQLHCTACDFVDHEAETVPFEAAAVKSAEIIPSALPGFEL